MATKKKEENKLAAAGAQTPPADPTVQPPPAKAAEEAKGKEVQLRDKDTGFYDPATGFQVVRDQKVKLGKTVGDATRVALQSGRLLIVED